LELRTAMSLARLWQCQDKEGDAFQLLNDVFAWFTEGFDAADLKEAQVLLNELGTMGQCYAQRLYGFIYPKTKVCLRFRPD
jgi:predicted ATPase